MQKMDTFNLGKSDIKITPIGLGTWQFSEGRSGAVGQWAPISKENTTEIIKQALIGGINWFDTAEIYGNGRSEKALSMGLIDQGIQDGEVVIATKWFPLFRMASSLKNSFKERQEVLSPFHIDLHQIHFPGSLSSIKKQANALADLLEEGLIKAVGVSNYSAAQMTSVHEQLVKRGFYLASNQVSYSLLDRSIEQNGILERAKELGITIIAYSPLGMGLLSGKFHQNPSLLNDRPIARRERLKRKLKQSQPLIEALSEIAKRHQATISQVSLNWILSYNQGKVVAIPGASKPKHIIESAGAMSFQLDEVEIKFLDELSQEFI
jgi:aryl-alcohol dehydrogenase-like predicted oxidoreductase